MISLEEAQNIIIQEVKPHGDIEKVPLSESVGRVLAVELMAPFSQPPFSNSAMDGFALKALDVKTATEESPVQLEVKKFQSAGSSFCELASQGATEIATGAPIPLGADAVIKKEDVHYESGKITVRRKVDEGENIRKKGEDLVEGTPILLKGEKIKVHTMGLLASFGFQSVAVMRRTRVSYFATGNELVQVGTPRQDHQIFNSNAFSLKALFQKEGGEFLDLGICKDSLTNHISFIQKALETSPELLVMTGGVSVGQHDFVREALEKMDAKILFHKVSIKPGKPILFAKLAKTFVFGLPGNPVSTQVGFYYFIYPTLAKLLNQQDVFLKTEGAFLQVKINRQKRHLLLPAIKRINQGTSYVLPIKQGSGNVAAFSLGNCFISIPSGDGQIEKDSMVSIQPYQ